MDTDVVIAPLDLEFAEEFHSLEIFDALSKVRKWCDISSGDFVKGAVVDDISHFLRILFRDHEG